MDSHRTREYTLGIHTGNSRQQFACVSKRLFKGERCWQLQIQFLMELQMESIGFLGVTRFHPSKWFSKQIHMTL